MIYGTGVGLVSKPGLRLYGAACEICKEKGINGIHLSLSDDGEYGMAMGGVRGP